MLFYTSNSVGIYTIHTYITSSRGGGWETGDILTQEVIFTEQKFTTEKKL